MISWTEFPCCEHCAHDYPLIGAGHQIRCTICLRSLSEECGVRYSELLRWLMGARDFAEESHVST